MIYYAFKRALNCFVWVATCVPRLTCEVTFVQYFYFYVNKQELQIFKFPLNL